MGKIQNQKKRCGFPPSSIASGDFALHNIVKTNLSFRSPAYTVTTFISGDSFSCQVLTHLQYLFSMQIIYVRTIRNVRKSTPAATPPPATASRTLPPTRTAHSQW
eukprot:6072290-Pleurochrysis_carterae.AAC.1